MLQGEWTLKSSCKWKKPDTHPSSFFTKSFKHVYQYKQLRKMKYIWKQQKLQQKVNPKHSYAGTDLVLIEFNKFLLSTNWESSTALCAKAKKWVPNSPWFKAGHTLVEI